MTHILLSYAFPLHLVVPGVNKRSFTPKVKCWQVQPAQERIVLKTNSIFLSSTLALLYDYVPLLKSSSGEPYFFLTERFSGVFWLVTMH